MYHLTPVGKINSLLTDKFSVPRQGNLIADLICELELLPPYNNPQALEQIAGFSHLWLIGIFSANVQANNAQRLMVRPPRLGGNQRVGVFASRSSFRPNNLSLSLVQLRQVKIEASGKVKLIIQGCDLIDQTPIVDIKPYIPFADSPLPGQEVKSGYVQAPETFLAPLERQGLFPQVPGVVWEFAPELLLPLGQSSLACLDYFSPEQLEALEQEFASQFKLATEQLAKVFYLSQILLKLIALNPKPAYKQASELEFGMSFANFEVRWHERTQNEPAEHKQGLFAQDQGVRYIKLLSVEKKDES